MLSLAQRRAGREDSPRSRVGDKSRNVWAHLSLDMTMTSMTLYRMSKKGTETTFWHLFRTIIHKTHYAMREGYSSEFAVLTPWVKLVSHCAILIHGRENRFDWHTSHNVTLSPYKGKIGLHNPIILFPLAGP